MVRQRAREVVIGEGGELKDEDGFADAAGCLF